MEKEPVINTVYISEEIERCEDAEELRERILPLLESQRNAWKTRIVQLMGERGLSQAEFAKRCDVSRNTVYKWCGGAIPRSRELFMRIGMGLELTVPEMNKLLQRWGRYPELYPKLPEDCVCQFILEHGYGDRNLKKYNYILDRIRDRIQVGQSEAGMEMRTTLLRDKLGSVRDEEELENFIEEHAAVFSSGFQKFYTYMIAFMMANTENANTSVGGMALEQGWSASLERCVSAIRQRKWFPNRNKLISIALHFEFDREETDELLKKAYMEPLCAKNLLESVVIFILESASLENIYDDPDLDRNALGQYALKVLKELDLPELQDFLYELSEMDDDV